MGQRVTASYPPAAPQGVEAAVVRAVALRGAAVAATETTGPVATGTATTSAGRENPAVAGRPRTALGRVLKIGAVARVPTEAGGVLGALPVRRAPQDAAPVHTEA